MGAAARDLYDDASRCSERIVDERLLTAKAAFGFWPANSVGDDIELYDRRCARDGRRPSSTRSASRWSSRRAGRTSPWPTSRRRARPASRTTSARSPSPPGTASTSSSPRFEADHDDYSAILAKALADRLAEAFAERLHELVRREFWGYSPDEHLPNDAIIREEYQGIRPAPGYPACPDHTEKGTLFELLEAEQRAGIRAHRVVRDVARARPSAATTSGTPRRTTSASGGSGRTSSPTTRARKGVDVETMARWLAPNLADA